MDIENQNDPLFEEIKTKADKLRIQPKPELFDRVSDLLDADQASQPRKSRPLYNFLGIAASLLVLLGCFWFIKDNINNTGNRQYASAAIFENLEDALGANRSGSIYNSSNIIKSTNAYYNSGMEEVQLSSPSLYQTDSAENNGYSSFSINKNISKIRSSKIEDNLAPVAALLGNWRFADVTPTNGANFPEQNAEQNVQDLQIIKEGNNFYLNVSSLNNPKNLSLKLDQSKIGGNTYLFLEHTDSNQLLINVKNLNQLQIGLMPNVSNSKLEKMGFEQNKANALSRTH